MPVCVCRPALNNAASLDAFGRALGLYGQRQEEARRRNAARAAKRQQLLELQGQPGAAEAQALLDELGEDEEVPRVPAKLLNNTAVLKYRCGWRRVGWCKYAGPADTTNTIRAGAGLPRCVVCACLVLCWAVLSAVCWGCHVDRLQGLSDG